MFRAEPALASDIQRGLRLRAARAAARAGAEAGGVSPADSPDGRKEWRRQAFSWLAEELRAHEAAADEGRITEERLLRSLHPWLEDRDLAPLRDADSAGWTALCDRIRALLHGRAR
jgi:hypothetical protein